MKTFILSLYTLSCAIFSGSLFAQLPQEIVPRDNGDTQSIWEDPVYIAVFVVFIAIMVGYYLYKRHAQKKREEEDDKVD